MYSIWFLVFDGEDTKKKKYRKICFFCQIFSSQSVRTIVARGRNSYIIIYTNGLGSPFAVVVVVVL